MGQQAVPRRQTKRPSRCMLAALGLSLLASCGRGGGDAVLRIGWLGDMSGPGAAAGRSEYQTLRMLVNDLNALGGAPVGETRYQLRLVGADTRGDPKEAVDLTRRLVNRDRVSVIIGPASDSSALPIAPLLEQAKIPAVATAASAQRVTVVDGTVVPYLFRVCFPDPYEGRVAAAWAYERLGFRRAAILYAAHDEYSKGLRDAFAEQFTHQGGVVVANLSYEAGAESLDGQAWAIVESRVGFVFAPTQAALAAEAMRALRAAGYRGMVVGGSVWQGPALAGEDALEGVFVVAQGHLSDPEVQEFRDRYLALYKTEPSFQACLAHDAFMLVLSALGKAGQSDGLPSGEALADALGSAEIPGITGIIRISALTHDPTNKPAVILKLTGGAFSIVEKYALP